MPNWPTQCRYRAAPDKIQTLASNAGWWNENFIRCVTVTNQSKLYSTALSQSWYVEMPFHVSQDGWKLLDKEYTLGTAWCSAQGVIYGLLQHYCGSILELRQHHKNNGHLPDISKYIAWSYPSPNLVRDMIIKWGRGLFLGASKWLYIIEEVQCMTSSHSTVNSGVEGCVYLS